MIRLSILLLGGVFVAMTVLGTEEPGAEAAVIQQETLAPMPEVEPGPAPAVAAEPEATRSDLVAAELARALAQRSVKPRAPKLLVVESADAPPEAAEPLVASLDMTLLEVTGSSVNLRAGPSTGQGIVGRLSRGARAELVAEAGGDWMQIRDPATGRVGFMAARFLKPAR
jgi:hypothetical protein